MKKILLYSSILVLIAIVSCSKSKSSPGESNGPKFNFISLTASDSTMTVNGVLAITATATGSGLKYKWSSDYGTVIGSGSSVQWTVCHPDDFYIGCEVTDGSGNSGKKEIKIHVR